LPDGAQPQHKQDIKDTSIQPLDAGGTESTLCLGISEQAWCGQC